MGWCFYCTCVSVSPGEGRGNPLQYSCLENPKDRGAGGCYSSWSLKESDTTKRLNNYLYSPQGSPGWDCLPWVPGSAGASLGLRLLSRGLSGQPGISCLGAGLTREHSRMAAGISKVTWLKLKRGSSIHLLVGGAGDPAPWGPASSTVPSPSSPLQHNTHTPH